MGFVLHDLALETTRRCNIRCEHCMRGECQNIDLTRDIVDIFLDNNEIKRIDHICFSGGEPTLNPNIIIYTIDKIIRENIDVLEIAMVTNGQIFCPELVEAFNRFNEYRNKRVRESLMKKYGKSKILEKDTLEKLINDSMDKHVRITFSNDRFHKCINSDVEEAYKKNAKGLKFTYFEVEDDDIYKTGFAEIGNDFNYKLDELRYFKEEDSYNVIDNIYVTATGFITSEGMGQYTDMDKINMGHVSEVSVREMLAEYGTPEFDTPKMTVDNMARKRNLEKSKKSV